MKCEWCSNEGLTVDNEGTKICIGCVYSEIERLRKLMEKIENDKIKRL